MGFGKAYSYACDSGTPFAIIQMRSANCKGAKDGHLDQPCADAGPYAGKSWYLIVYDASTVTLLSKECVGSSVYNQSVSTDLV